MSRDAGWEPDIGASGKEKADNREEKAEKKDAQKSKKPEAKKPESKKPAPKKGQSNKK